MFRQTLNRAVIRIELATVSPLLIRAGDTGLDPAQADLSCVRTRHATLGSTVYVPGSSAKGVIRSTAESLIRGLTLDDVTPACDPLDHRASCGGTWSKGANKTRPSTDVHRGHCLACRLFGSTALRGRCAIRDLFPFTAAEATVGQPTPNFTAANRIETRNGVGIDRIAGSVRPGALFDFEMVPAGVRFYGDIALTNVQAWQLGLLAAALRELDEGFAQLGSTKTRGLGVVKARATSLAFEQTVRGPAHPVGVGHLTTEAAYGLLPEHKLPPLAGKSRGLTRRFTAEGDAAQTWLAATEDALAVLA